AIALVAPGVQIPVVAVMGKALRRDFALRLFVLSASVIADGETLPLQQSARYGLEMFAGAVASRHAQDAHAPGDFAAVELSGGKQFFHALLDRFEVAVEQAGLTLFE